MLLRPDQGKVAGGVLQASNVEWVPVAYVGPVSRGDGAGNVKVSAYLLPRTSSLATIQSSAKQTLDA